MQQLSIWRRARAEHGFGLVEVMVAVLIVSLAMISLLTVLLTSDKANQTMQSQSQGYTLASQAIAQVSEGDYDNLCLTGTAYPSAANGGGTPIPHAAAGAAGSVDTTDAPASFTGPAGVKENLVTCSGSQHGVAPVSYVNVSTGQTGSSGCGGAPPSGAAATGNQCALVERFITWAPQSCPVLNLANLLPTLLSPMQGTVSQVQGLLNSVLGGLSLDLAPYRTTSGFSTTLSQIVGYLGNSVGGLTSGLTGGLNGMLNTLLKQGLGPLTTPLTSVLNALSALLADGSGLTDLDLCKLPNLDLSSLSAINGALAAVNALLTNPAFKQLTQALDDLVQLVPSVLDDVLSGNVFALLGDLTGSVLKVTRDLTNLITSLPDALSGSVNTLVAGLRGLNQLPQLLPNLEQLLWGGKLTVSLSGVATSGCTLTGAAPFVVNSSGAGIGSCGLLGYLFAPTGTNVDQTKRITVAVVMPRQPGGPPAQPSWQSALMTNPGDGLL